MLIEYKVTADSSTKSLEVPLPNTLKEATNRLTEETIFHHMKANMIVKVQGKIRTHFKALAEGKTSKLPKGQKEWDVYLTPTTPKTLGEKLLALGLSDDEIKVLIKSRSKKTPK